MCGGYAKEKWRYKDGILNKAKAFYKSTGVHNGSNTYNEIIHASYTLGGELLNDYNSTGFKRNNSIVDIVSDYPWSIDSV